MLPRDLALQMIGRWFTMRNSPGAVGNTVEWTLFIRCLLTMMGYDTAKLTLTNKVTVLIFILASVIALSRAQKHDVSVKPTESPSRSYMGGGGQGLGQDWEINCLDALIPFSKGREHIHTKCGSCL